MAAAPIRNIWSKNGLDLTDSAFSKVYLSEIGFSQKDDKGETLQKFDLESERFEELRTILTVKQNRMAMKRLLKVQEGTQNLDLLDQPQLISKATMLAQRDAIWQAPVDLANDSQEDVNTVYDKQLKCHAFGIFLVNALSISALKKLESTKLEWSVTVNDEEYVHGPLLFWFFVDTVKPNNDTLVQQTKEKLGRLDVKDFDHSVRDMLIEFDNLVMEVEIRLKGQITEDEKVSALWRALETMKDEHFARIVTDEKRSYRRTPVANRKDNAELIALFKREQTDLEADGKWNKPNKDSQILALTSILRSVVKQVNNVASVRPRFGNKNDSTSTDNNRKSGEPRKNERSPTPPWKFQREDDATQLERDGKIYYWCDKHQNPNPGLTGMWTLHKPEDHKGKNFSKDDRAIDASAKSSSTESDSAHPSVQVDSRLLAALSTGADVTHFLDGLDVNETELN